jgi:hypothetical protein
VVLHKCRKFYIYFTIGKTTLRRPKHRWDNKSKIIIKESVNWTKLAQNYAQRGHIAKTVINIGGPKGQEIA